MELQTSIQEANAVGAIHMFPRWSMGITGNVFFEYWKNLWNGSAIHPSSWEWTLNMKTYVTLPATVALLSNNRLCRWLNSNEPINDGSLEEMIPNSAVQVFIPSIQGLWSFIGPCVAYFSGTEVVWRVVWGVDETMTQQIPANTFHNIIYGSKNYRF